MDLSLGRSICHSDRLKWGPRGCGSRPSAPRVDNIRRLVWSLVHSGHRNMAETSPLDRVRSLARVVAADVGVHPRAGRRVRQLFGSINIWFWAIVGLPTLVAGVYYFAIASDLYLSEAKFIVRSPKQVQTSSIGALIQSTGLARAVDDTAVVEDFIMSRDAVRRLERENDLRALFGRPEGDFVTRFPGILMRSDFEALFRRYDHFVSVETDHTSGVTALRV